MTRWGLDAVGVPDPQQAWDLGWRVLCRYLSPAPNPKNLTRDEVAKDHAIGFDVWPNFEFDINDALRGADFGKQAMTIATQELLAAGAPADGRNADGTRICVPFSCDTMAMADQVRPFYQGCGSVGSPFLVGAYGGATPMVPLLTEGTIHRWWQANAGSWSGQQSANFATHPLADCRQFVGMPQGAPPWPIGSFDANVFMHDEVGLWKAPKSMPRSLAITVSQEDSTVAHVFNPTRNRWDEITVGVDHRLYGRAAPTFDQLAAGSNGPIGDTATLAKRIGGLVWADADTLTLSVHGMDDAVYHLTMTVAGGWGPAVPVKNTLLLADAPASVLSDADRASITAAAASQAAPKVIAKLVNDLKTANPAAA